VKASASMESKMHDEMMENRKGSGTLETGLGEDDAKVMGKVVLKMDVRYVLFSFFFLHRMIHVADYDASILPILALLFLCSFIDRTNVGNAKILGLEKDIHINDHQYAIGLCVFYATYIAR
jgi:hypothetical protein